MNYDRFEAILSGKAEPNLSDDDEVMVHHLRRAVIRTEQAKRIEAIDSYKHYQELLRRMGYAETEQE